MFVGNATSTTVTYIQGDLAGNRHINTTIDGLYASKTTIKLRRHGSGFDLKAALSKITCCNEGILTINVADHIMVNINFNVNGELYDNLISNMPKLRPPLQRIQVREV